MFSATADPLAPHANFNSDSRVAVVPDEIEVILARDRVQ